MREKDKCAKCKLAEIKYQEQIGNISHEEAEEIRAAQIAKIYRTARIVR